MKKLILIYFVLLQVTIVNAQWYQVSSNVSVEKLNDIVFIDDNVGFCVGGFNQSSTNPAGHGIILKSIDGGENWSVVYDNPGITSINYIVNIDNEIVAFGSSSSDQYKYTSSDNGNTWQSTPLTYSVWDVRTSGNNIFFRENYYSSTLKKLDINDVISTIATNVGKYGINDNELIYVNSSYDTIYKSIDYGNTFQALNGYPTGFSQNQETNAVIRSFNDTLIVHYTYPPETQYSLDNGDNWTLIDGSGADYSEIISDSLIMGSNDNELSSQVNFQPWENQAVLTDKIRKIYIYDENLGFVIGDNGMIYKTTNVEGLSTNDVNIEKKKIKIIPNPATDMLIIENTGNINIKSLELFDLSGKKVKDFRINTNQLDISSLSNGTYLLRITTPRT